MSELKLAGVLEKESKELDEVDVDYLVYRSYRYQREHAPTITPDQWASCFPRTAQLEARYQREKALEVGSKVTRMYKGHSLDSQDFN
jgi:hypothetical protein